MQGDLLASILNPKDANEFAFANVAHKAKLTTTSHTTAPPLHNAAFKRFYYFTLGRVCPHVFPGARRTINLSNIRCMSYVCKVMYWRPHRHITLQHSIQNSGQRCSSPTKPRTGVYEADSRSSFVLPHGSDSVLSCCHEVRRTTIAIQGWATTPRPSTGGSPSHQNNPTP